MNLILGMAILAFGLCDHAALGYDHYRHLEFREQMMSQFLNELDFKCLTWIGDVFIEDIPMVTIALDQKNDFIPNCMSLIKLSNAIQN